MRGDSIKPIRGPWSAARAVPKLEIRHSAVFEVLVDLRVPAGKSPTSTPTKGFEGRYRLKTAGRTSLVGVPVPPVSILHQKGGAS